MRQIVAIHGGEIFENYEKYLGFLANLEIDLDFYRKSGWRSKLPEVLGKDFDVLLLKMPNALNAQYKEWEIVFRKVAELLDENPILIGHSLGGVFLMKYLSENNFPRKIKALFSVAAPYVGDYRSNDLCGFEPGKDLSKVSEQAEKIFLIHSKDDAIVPFSEFEAYAKALPSAEQMIFEDRGHFNQGEFSELVEAIKKIT